jgi:O-antigen ligase
MERKLSYSNRIISVLFFSCVLSVFVWLFWRYGGVLETDKIGFVLISVFLTVFFLNYSFLTGKEIAVPDNRLVIPLVLFSLWVLVKSIFSVYHWHSILNMGLFFGLSGVFLILFSLRKNRIFLNAVPVVCLPFLFYTVLQMKGVMPHHWWAVDSMVSSTLVNSNHFAAFLNLLFFLVFAFFFSAKSRVIKGILFFYSLLIIYLIAMARSRAGIICFATGLLFFAGMSLGSLKRGRKVVLSLVFLLFFAISFWIIRSQTTERFLKWKVEPASITQRLQIWKTCSIIAYNHPLGVGNGAFSSIYPVYRTHSDRFLVNYAHNEFFQVLVETGIPGLALFLLLLFVFVREMKKTEWNYVKTGIAAGLVSISVHSLVDFPIHVPAVFLLTIFFVSHLDIKKRNILLSRKALIPFNIVLILIILFFVSFLKAEICWERGKKAEGDGWQKALPFYEKSLAFNVFKSDFPARIAYNNLLYGGFAGKESIQYRYEAVEYYKIAVKRGPYNSFYQYGLAIAQKHLGETNESFKSFERAISLNPTYGPFYIVYGRYLEEEGYHEKGEEKIKKGLSLFHEGP